MISVIIPVYNGEASLDGCLQALGQQTLSADEIILVDDGSTDGTLALAEHYPVTVLRQEHRGPAAARNLGARSAVGDILLFTDADCEPVQDWIAEMTNPFADPAVAGVKGAYLTRQKGVVARLVQCEFEERYDLLERQPRIDFVDTYAAAFRAQAFHQVQGFDEAFPYANNEDVDLSYRMAAAGYQFVFNRRATVFHRHPDGWRKYFRLKINRAYWRTVVYRMHPGKAVRDSYTPQWIKLQVLAFYLGMGLLAGAVFLPILAWGAAAAFVLLLASAFPFIRQAGKQDGSMLLWAPLGVLLRSAAFGVGIAASLLGSLGFQTRLERRG